MLKRKGIILAGGTGSRLHPLTITTSKQLLPIYDKPLVYYPLSVLMLAGITEIAVITTPAQGADFRRLLGDGSKLGIALHYIPQPRPEGLAQACLLAEDWLAGAPSALVLGDNIFHGHGLSRVLQAASARAIGATVFGCQVSDPTRYGVIGFDGRGRVTSIEEKPEVPASDFAATGLYFLDADASRRARALRPSARGELEITDLLRLYLHDDLLRVELLGRGYAWFDTGTHESLLDASEFVRTIERRQGLKLGCIEEVAYHQGLIGAEQLMALARPLIRTGYGQYLRKIALSQPSGSVRELRSIA